MGREYIIKKLQNFLKSHPKFKEEYEVVYLMIEIRKILDDLKNIKLPNNTINHYKTLRLYCNWVAHIKLSKQSADIVIKKFKQVINKNKGLEEIKQGIKANNGFFVLDDLYYELINFFRKYNLPQNILSRNREWIKFRKHLLEIISESAFDLSKSKKITSLNVEKNKKTGKYYYRFKLSFYVKNLQNEDRNVLKIKLGV